MSNDNPFDVPPPKPNLDLHHLDIAVHHNGQLSPALMELTRVFLSRVIECVGNNLPAVSFGGEFQDLNNPTLTEGFNAFIVRDEKAYDILLAVLNAQFKQEPIEEEVTPGIDLLAKKLVDDAFKDIDPRRN